MNPTSKTRYFCARNASIPVACKTVEINFMPCALIGGAMKGVFSTSDPEVAKLVEEVSLNPKSGVCEIDQQEYDRLLKKKSLGARANSVDIGRIATKEQNQRFAADGSVKQLPPSKPKVFESLEEAVQTGQVATTEMPVFSKGKKRGSK